jgi:hypothetical protein
MKSILEIIFFGICFFYFISMLLMPILLFTFFKMIRFLKLSRHKLVQNMSEVLLKKYVPLSISSSQESRLVNFGNTNTSSPNNYSGNHISSIQMAFRETIDVLIPAHNEQEYLALTIESVRKSFSVSGRDCRIIVGLDLCEDHTLDVASRLADLVVSVQFGSKWNTLNYLAQFVKSGWVAFVDVGVLWPENLVRSFSEFENSPDLLFIAPGYQQLKSSFLQKINWRFESCLKNFENEAGGPISVHGASVFYKNEFLVKAMHSLEFKNWLNDDVIIPLVLRAQNPLAKGLYLANEVVTDMPPLKRQSQRRNRISLGNLEILEFIHAKKIPLNWILQLLWLRREMRIFWAYFLISALIGIRFFDLSWFLNFDMLIGLVFVISLSRRVFRVSLKAPFILLKNVLFKEIINNASVRWH